MSENQNQQHHQHRGHRRHQQPRKAVDNRYDNYSSSSEVQAFTNRPLADITYTVFDIENTGGNPERNGITEICALRVVNGEVIDKFYTLVNPKMSIPPIVRRMTGIDNKMVRNAPVIEDVMPDFVEFVKGTVLVSHNTIGDMKFLKYYSQQTTGKAIDNFFLCTHLLVERLVTEAKNRTLKGLAQHFRFVPKGDVHRADADAYLTLDLFKEIYRRFGAKKIETLADAIRLQADYESGMRLGWAIKEAQLEALPNTPGVFELYDRLGHLHFASAALNLKRDVRRLLKYSQLPKPMLRLVLSTYALKHRTTSSQFAAVYEESKVLSTHKNLFRPSIWHQRTVPGICLQPAPEGKMEIYMGDLQRNVVAAYGPMNDRKELSRILTRVVEACGGETNKRFFTSLKYRTLITEYLAGRLDALEERYLAKSKEMIWSFVFGARKKVREQLAIIENLKKIKLPTGLLSINEMKGVLIVRGEEPENFNLYRLKYGRITAAGHYRGAMNAFPTAKNIIRNQLKYLASRKGLHIPLSHAEAMHANAALWWVICHSGGQDGMYYSDSELASMIL